VIQNIVCLISVLSTDRICFYQPIKENIMGAVKAMYMEYQDVRVKQGKSALPLENDNQSMQLFESEFNAWLDHIEQQQAKDAEYE